VEDVAAPACEGDEGFVVAFALGDLAVVVGAGDGVSEGCEGGEEERPFEHVVSAPRWVLDSAWVRFLSSPLASGCWLG